MPDKIRMTAEQIYDTLINRDGIKTAKGQISFNLCDIDVIVKNKDIVGGALENWVNQWLIDNNVDFEFNAQTQSKPDLYLDPDNKEHQLLEVKSFNREKTPAFDIADFVGFAFELIHKPYLLDIDCLVFGYSMDIETGDITVKDIWLKKIWEVAATSGEWALKVQGTEDKSIIKKVRPGTWYSNRARFKCFESKLDFLSAYEQTLYDYQATRARASNWKFQLKQSYYNYYGEELIIPRWDDIKHNYLRQGGIILWLKRKKKQQLYLN